AGRDGVVVRLTWRAHRRLRAAAGLSARGEPNDHRVARHVVTDDPAVAVGRLDGAPDLRGARLELLVERVLVLETAQQPAACAGDLQRVDRQVLVLRHPD